MSEHFTKANALFVEENYDDALEAYNQAIEEQPNKVEFYVHRAACHDKLGNHLESLEDANHALKLEPENAKATFRKGVALFQLEEYETAKATLEKARSMDSSLPNLVTWLRKCEAEIQSENGGASAAKKPAPETNPQTTPTPAASVSASASSSPSPSPSTTASSATSAPTPAPAAPAKFRHEWYQNQNYVYVTVFAKNIAAQDLTVNIQPKHLDITIKTSSSSDITFNFDLCCEVDPSGSSFERLSTKIEVKLKKVELIKWESLEAPESADVIAVRPWADTSSTNKHVYPTSSKKKKDWDSLEKEAVKEAEANLSSEESLNKFFQDLYKGGNEELRRAMNKSFVESDGTVLSTNWSEVGSKKIERQASSDEKKSS